MGSSVNFSDLEISFQASFSCLSAEKATAADTIKGYESWAVGKTRLNPYCSIFSTIKHIQTALKCSLKHSSRSTCTQC